MIILVINHNQKNVSVLKETWNFSPKIKLTNSLTPTCFLSVILFFFSSLHRMLNIHWAQWPRRLGEHQCSHVGFASGCWVAQWGSSASALYLEVQESSFLFLDFVSFIISSIASLNLLKWTCGIIFSL